jgi:proteasome lid subunit RPN8/RPN11
MTGSSRAPGGAGPEVLDVGEPPLRLDRGTWDALVDHAFSDTPYEVCGLLGIEPDGTIHLHRITNDQRSMTYYAMNPRELLRAMREIEDHEQELVIYHSHTHTHAWPSATDVRQAHYPEATYAIITLQDRDNPDVRAFRIRDGEVTERLVEVVDD